MPLLARHASCCSYCRLGCNNERLTCGFDDKKDSSGGLIVYTSGGGDLTRLRVNAEHGKRLTGKLRHNLVYHLGVRPRITVNSSHLA